MQKNTIFKAITALLLVAVIMAAGLAGCSSYGSGDIGNSGNPGNSDNSGNPGNSSNPGNSDNSGNPSDSSNLGNSSSAEDPGNSGNSDESGNPGDSGNPGNSSNSEDHVNSESPGNSGNSDDSGNPGNSGNSDSQGTNKGIINIVWYPNESGNTHAAVRSEVEKLVRQATGREAKSVTTTDYTIAIEAIASGSADIAMAMGAVGYIEAKNRNPAVDVMFTNADADGGIEGAKYFSWLCVPVDKSGDYKNGDDFSIDNIKGKKMSFVSNSSTSGFKVPTSSIILHFADYFKDFANDEAKQEDLLPEGGFFSEVFFGQSHQGSAINLITGNADVAAFCDIELQAYIELKPGTENTVGAVYAVKAGAEAPFSAHAGKEFTVIACTPVFNGPNAVNPKNLSADEIKAITDLFTSAEVTNNKIIFFDGDDPNATGLYKIGTSKGYIAVDDSWYDAYR